MEIVRRSVRGVTLLDLTGRLTVSPSDVEIAPLRAAIGELVASGCAHIGLNLSGLTHLDARGLGELVLALKTVHRRGGQLTLVAPSAPVLKILAVTRLDTIFDRCESETELLARAFPQVSAGGRGHARMDAAAYG